MNRSLWLLLTCFLTSSALACDCAVPTVDEYRSKCEQLFVATLIESKLVSKTESDRLTTIVEEGKLSEPIKVLIGNADGNSTISNHDSGSSCGERLSVGSDYVVCVSDGAPLNNYMCGYTRNLYGQLDGFLKEFEVE